MHSVAFIVDDDDDDDKEEEEEEEDEASPLRRVFCCRVGGGDFRADRSSDELFFRKKQVRDEFTNERLQPADEAARCDVRAVALPSTKMSEDCSGFHCGCDCERLSLLPNCTDDDDVDRTNSLMLSATNSDTHQERSLVHDRT